MYRIECTFSSLNNEFDISSIKYPRSNIMYQFLSINIEYQKIPQGGYMQDPRGGKEGFTYFKIILF